MKKLSASMAAVLLAYGINSLIATTIDVVRESDYKQFEYEEDNVDYIALGSVDYSTVSKWFIVEVKNGKSNTLRIINEDGIDVLNKEEVTTIYELDDTFVSLDENILNIESLSDYLTEEDEEKLFTPNDINNLIELISTNYNWHKEKILKIAY